jgi:hypothetical protein
MRTTGNSWASTPDSAANSVTGDIDLRARVKMNDWTQAGDAILADKFGSGQKTFEWYMSAGGNLTCVWSTNGSANIASQSTAATGFTDGTTHWVRVTRASATGQVIFYTSNDTTTDSAAVSWTQLGTAVAATSGALFNGTSVLTVGDVNGGGVPLLGDFYYFEIRNGIGGSVVCKFDPSAVVRTALRTPSSFVASTGETWTMNGTAWDWATV